MVAPIRNIVNYQGNASSYTVSNIPQDAKHLMVLVTAPNASNGSPVVTFNNWSSGWDFQMIFAGSNPGSQSSGSTGLSTMSNVAYFPGPSDRKGFSLIVPLYASSNGYRPMLHQRVGYVSNQFFTNAYYDIATYANTSNTSAITSIQFTSMPTGGYCISVDLVG